MQTTWLRQGVSDSLKIYVLGWAADPSMIAPESECDTLCVYDYRTIEPLVIEYPYRKIDLIAWSYGVWAAEQMLRGVELTSAIAINGTPYPLNAEWGIHPRIFAKSVDNINIDVFARRMCSGMKQIVVIKRPQDECREELRILAEQFNREYTPHIDWNLAVVGGCDLIYPPVSQQRYWQSRGISIEYRQDMPHYFG